MVKYKKKTHVKKIQNMLLSKAVFPLKFVNINIVLQNCFTIYENIFYR